jgi:hypothetical protein
MTWLAIIVILIVVCLSLVIFAPKNKTFRDRRIYPTLEIVSDPMHTQLIRDDIKSLEQEDFVDYPDEEMWKFNKSSDYKIFPFYMFGTFSRKNINKCQDTFKIAHNIPYIRTMAFIKIGAKSVLKVHQNWKDVSNETFRCFLGINVPTSDVDVCGIWVEGDAKKLEDNKWVVFDASRKHSIYNKYTKDCYLLMFDLQRPDNTTGCSDQKLPSDIMSFVKTFTNQETDDANMGKPLQQLPETE